MASVILTYILWLCGGWVGLHHFYLGRDKQAFLWWSTFGGCFGLGWLRDFFRIPAYVADSTTADEPFHPPFPYPPLSWTRSLAQAAIGYYFGLLIRLAVPDEILDEYFVLKLIIHAFIPLGVGIGIHLVGSVGGREEGSFKYALLAASLPVPLIIQEANTLSYSAILGNLAYAYTRRWKSGPKPKKSLPKRVAILTAAGILYLSIWSSILIFNVKFEGPEGEQVRLSDAIYNFFQSQAWKDFKSRVAELWQVFLDEGWDKMWLRFKKDFDISGTQHACEILSVDCEGATQEEIRSACRRLSREWHPDKHKDEEQKKLAQEKFIEIQDACQKLDDKRRRAKGRSRLDD